MPYVITTKRLHAITAAPGCDDYIALSRRAVATLEEARLAARQTVVDLPGDIPGRDLIRWFDEATVFSEAGGPVGPLPDGTVIEVERVQWIDPMWSESLRPDVYVSNRDAAIDAYNAAQATSAR